MLAGRRGSRFSGLLLAMFLAGCGGANVRPAGSDASPGDIGAAILPDAESALDSSIEEDASHIGVDAAIARDASVAPGIDAASYWDAAVTTPDTGSVPAFDASAPDAGGYDADIVDIGDAGGPEKQGPYGDCSSGLASCTVAGSECSKDSTGSVCAPPCVHDQDCPPLAGSATAPKCAVFGPTGTSHCYVECVNVPADTCPAPMMCLALFAPSPQCGWECPTGWCK
jgi:hypothetical protein